MQSHLCPLMRCLRYVADRTRNRHALAALDWLAGTLLAWHVRAGV